MYNQLQQIESLEINKSVSFRSPIEGEYNLARTGTIGEGSCFFHSILHAYSREYVSYDNTERMKFVRILRDTIAHRITKEIWEHIGNGMTALIPFQENVHNILQDVFLFFETNERHISERKSVLKVITALVGTDKLKYDMYKLVVDTLPFQKCFEKIILPNASIISAESVSSYTASVIEATDAFVKELDVLSNISSIEVLKFSNTVTVFITTILAEAKNKTFKSFIRGLRNVSEHVDSHTIGVISDHFKRDIYFIDASTRLPYRTADTYNLKGRTSIIVLWINQNHYEVVGKVLSDNKIKREFEPNDPLIVKIKTFINNPELIPDLHPELIPYIPRDIRGRIIVPSTEYPGAIDSCTEEPDRASVQSDDWYNYY